MRKVIFKDVVKRVNINVDRHNTERLYYVGGEHIDSDELLVTKQGLIKGSTIGFKFHFGFNPGHILFMSRNPHLRKASMATFEGICSDSTYVVETRDNNILLQEYLLLEMQSDRFWNWAEANKSGGVNYLINYKTLDTYEFDIPSIAEQKVLTEKLWAAYEVKQSYQRMIDATDEMLKSQFVEIFADVSTGGTPSKAHPEYWNGDKPWVSAEDMKNKYVYDTREKVTDAGYATCKILPIDSLMFVCRGSIGVMAINKIECATNQSICRASCYKNVCHVEFLYHSLMYQRDSIKKIGTGTSFKSLNQTTFSELKIELPPYGEQLKFVSIAQQADKSKAELRKSIVAIEKVIKSIINEKL